MTPGSATAERARLELDLSGEVTAILAEWMSAVRVDASGALDSRVLLAAGGRPFSLGAVMGTWEGAVERMLGVFGRAFGLSPRDPYLAGMLARLKSSPLPGSVYSSARAVLQASLDGQWSKAETRRRLASALDPKTASAVRTVDGLEEQGVSWDALARRLTRTETTAAYGHTVLQRVAADPAFSRKRWVSHHDGRTRETHAAADGQTVKVSSSFLVGGYALLAPGDPFGPTQETANCRCVIVGVP